jgi:3-oxoacid CoA-transferase subunit A
MVIGGGYSVDKYYRLEVGNNWFPMEQLSPEEREKITTDLRAGDYKLILAHTCPYSWRPTDLFLTCVDQSTVDSSMELWLEEIKDSFKDAIYLFGHYHAERLVRPKAEMYYYNIDTLDHIIQRWDENREGGVEELMFLNKDPNYYMGR